MRIPKLHEAALINAFTLLHLFIYTQWRFLNIQTFLHSPGGYIVVKENVTSSGEVERDEEDR